MRRFGLALTSFAALAGACASDPVDAPDAGAPVDAAVASMDAAPASMDAAVPDAAAPSCAAPPHAAACDDALCVVPAGCFLMGSPEDEPCRDVGEVRHEVRLTHDFLLSRRELTRREIRDVLGYEVYGVLIDHPAGELTWHEVAAYANHLSARDALAPCYVCTGDARGVRCTPAPEYAADIYQCPGYRHPTEAEWEYAYRAGSSDALYNGAITATCSADPRADEIGWSSSNSRRAVHAPGGRAPNAWGLEDMAGNLFEWTFDRAGALSAEPATDPAVPPGGESDEMIMRSGSWDADLHFMRAAARVAFPADLPVFVLGGRVARTLGRDAPRPTGVTTLGTLDAPPVGCSPNQVAAPIQVPAGPRIHAQIPFAGRDQLLLVDTGSPYTTFYLPPTAPDLTPGLGLVTIGCEQVPFFGRNVRFGQVVRGLPVLGAIGTDWLRTAPTAIDLAEESLTRWSSADEIVGRDQLVRLPVTLVPPGFWLVSVRIDGTDVRLLLDTGTPRTLWIGPTGAPTDPEIVLVGEGGDQWPVREGPGRIELAGEPAITQPIWRAPSLGSLETFLHSLGPDVVGILGLASLERRRVYFGVEDDAVLLGPR